MIHAEYCYDSDPIDRWFEEDVEITDIVYWHLERYFDIEHIHLTDESHWEFYVHWGGYRVALGGMLNQPVRAILNQPGIWIPEKDETFNVGSEVAIEVNGVEVYRRASTPQVMTIVQQGIEWIAHRLSNSGMSVALIQVGGNNDGTGALIPTDPDMVNMIGPYLDLAPLTIRGGTVQGQSIVYEASLNLDAGPYQVGELALFTGDRKMIAREALTARITKDAGIPFDITWTITIA